MPTAVYLISGDIWIRSQSTSTKCAILCTVNSTEAVFRLKLSLSFEKPAFNDHSHDTASSNLCNLVFYHNNFQANTFNYDHFNFHPNNSNWKSANTLKWLKTKYEPDRNDVPQQQNSLLTLQSATEANWDKLMQLISSQSSFARSVPTSSTPSQTSE